MQGYVVFLIILDQESANYGMWVKSSPPLVFVKNTSLEHSLVHSTTYGCSGGYKATTVETETIWAMKPEILTMWPFTGRVCLPLT